MAFRRLSASAAGDGRGVGTAMVAISPARACCSRIFSLGMEWPEGSVTYRGMQDSAEGRRRRNCSYSSFSRYERAVLLDIERSGPLYSSCFPRTHCPCLFFQSKKFLFHFYEVTSKNARTLLRPIKFRHVNNFNRR
jgi:hypothetical protein